MSDSQKKEVARGLVGESLDFTYRLIEASAQNQRGAIDPSPLRGHKVNSLRQEYEGHSHLLDLSSPGNLVSPELAESSLKEALEYLANDMLICIERMPFLQSDMLQDLVLFMEDYVMQKINLKVEALSDFFGSPLDAEQQVIFKMLLRKYSSKMRNIDASELEKLKLLCSRVIVQSMAHYNEISERTMAKGGLKLISSEIEAITSHLEAERETPEFAVAIKQLHESTLLLLLSYIPCTFGIEHASKRQHRYKKFKDHEMFNLNGPSRPGDACIVVLPPLLFHGSIQKSPEFVVCLRHECLTVESPTFNKTDSCVSFAPKHCSPHQNLTLQDYNRNTSNGEKASELFAAVRQETVITFEASDGNIALPKAKRKKKSVTFSEKDWIIEYDSEQASDNEKRGMQFKSNQGVPGSIFDLENKENVPAGPKDGGNQRKMLNLKELQLNPKHFVGRRQQSTTKLKLIHDSEESIDVSKGHQKDQNANKSQSRALPMKDQQSSREILSKKVNLSKESANQPKSHQSSQEKKQESNNASLCRPGSGQSRRLTGTPLVEIDLNNSSKRSARDKSNTSLQKKIDEMTKLTLESRQYLEAKIPLNAGNASSKRQTIRQRSASSHSLKPVQPQNHSLSLLSRNKENRKPQVGCLEEPESTARGRLGRSLSSSRRLGSKTYMNTVNEPLSKHSYFDKRSESFSKREEKSSKPNIFSSKLNFLNYDKQPREGQRGLLSGRAQDKPSVIDMAVYRKIFAANSSRAGKNTGARIGGLNLFAN